MEEVVKQKERKSLHQEQTDNVDRSLCGKKKHKGKDREKVEFQEDIKRTKSDSHDSVSLSQEIDGEHKCKKKKHKHLTKDVQETISCYKDGSVKKKKKKQKKCTKDIRQDLHISDNESIKNKQKKKKWKLEDHDSQTKTSDSEQGNFTNSEVVKKKHGKKTKFIESNGDAVETESCTKKNKKRDLEQGNFTNSEIVRKKQRKKTKFIESNDDAVETESCTKKNKKSKEKDKNLKKNKVPADDACTPVKKKKRKHLNLDNEESEMKISEIEADNFHKNKKRKKNNKQNHEENKIDQMKGNADTYNKKENSKTLPVNSEYTDPVSGQWGTASLGSNERQQKFLRLLGGFKKEGGNKTLPGIKPKRKGLFGSLGQQGGNYAMDAKQEEIYSSDMTTQYEKAMSMNLQRGIGLGYEPPPGAGKKFHIDETKSKSIKFDD